MTRDELRRLARARRRSVTAALRKIASHRFAVIANRSRLLRPGQRIAVYLAYGHEADPARLIDAALRRGCRIYLPVISHRRRSEMRFVEYLPTMTLRRNSFGIPEPARDHWRPISSLRLDAVFAPLVAFDPNGGRLGSGAGFYDRALRRLQRAAQWRRPKLIGIAYDCQLVENTLPDAWDVPLDAVVTETTLYTFNAKKTGAMQ